MRWASTGNPREADGRKTLQTQKKIHDVEASLL
jgi:hypothetical protein